MQDDYNTAARNQKMTTACIYDISEVILKKNESEIASVIGEIVQTSLIGLFQQYQWSAKATWIK